MANLIGSYFKPARGGHAPGDLRNAFEEACEAFMAANEGEEMEPVDLRGKPVDLMTLTGLLWNCSDIAPGSFCATIADLGGWEQFDSFYRGGKTYAQCARLVRQHLQQEAM